jgi:hypothetical protein
VAPAFALHKPHTPGASLPVPIWFGKFAQFSESQVPGFFKPSFFKLSFSD